ncbi:hypothetical protein JCM30760_08100 [Thiomicrorhabdus hydrogeniphila]
MATTDGTFDPNDLESIDALLDEAELEAVSDNLDDSEQVEDNLEIPEESTNLSAEDEDLLDSLDSLDDLVSPDAEPEVVGVSEPVVKTAKATKEDIPKLNIEPEKDTEQLANEEILVKRGKAQSSKNSKAAAKDMDSIKKLIIIFGSILSVLALIAIGIGIWGALSASSAGMDEDTHTLIETIKVSTEHNGQAAQSAEKSVKSVEKKLDALAFQLEQLTEDVGKIGQVAAPAENSIIDPLGLSAPATDKNHAGNNVVSAPVSPAITKSVGVADSELMNKVSSVNKKLISAQRRINEVNTRVKKIQAQYATLIHSIKTVEKQVLVEQAEKMAKQEKAKKAADKNRYQYTAPDGGFYDQSVGDSYP